LLCLGGLPQGLVALRLGLASNDLLTRDLLALRQDLLA
jgi:hypothetical protein